MNESTLLIICDDAGFARQVITHWQAHGKPPQFTVLQGDITQRSLPDGVDVAIVGPVRDFSGVLEAFNSSGSAILTAGVPTSATLRAQYPRAVFVPEIDAWVEVLVLIASEMVQRVQAQKHAAAAEQAQAKLQCHATLGKYMLDMRHGLNNALTSVLGNAELLLLEPGSLSASTRLQVETIRNMAVRMHEVIQRFTSIEKELTTAERQVASSHANAATRAAGRA